MMECSTFGRPELPLLICVPGLLGGVEDFASMIRPWSERFHVMVLDPNAQRRSAGRVQVSEAVMREISYASTSQEIAQAIDAANAPGAFLTGVSLGGKIVYDFAAKYPDKFLGGLITDVGTGPFEDSDLHKFVYHTVTRAPLHLPWPEMREYLRTTISDRSLRSLIQTQISYPNLRPPGIWKTAMKNFGEMLERQEIGHQFAGLHRVDPSLTQRGTLIKVLQAETISGIGEASVPQMNSLNSLRLIRVPGSSHFLHITHKDLIVNEVLSLLTGTGGQR